MSLEHGYCCLVRYDECWFYATFMDMTEWAGYFIVYLTKERREWLTGRCVSCTCDRGELTAKKDEIVRGGKAKVELVLELRYCCSFGAFNVGLFDYRV